MTEIPSEILERCESYCAPHSKELKTFRGYGVDGYVWQTTQGDILKVYRRAHAFERELAVYQRLETKSLYRLQGFFIPVLIDFDEELWASR